MLVVLVVVQSSWVGHAEAATNTPRRGPKVEPELLAAAKANPSQDFNVIVRTVQAGTKHDHVERAGAAIHRGDGKPKHGLGIIGGTSATLSGKALVHLAHDPDVESIVADRKLKASFDPVADAAKVTSPGIAEVRAPAVWAQLGVTGRGVGVAVVDSGVADHPDLAGRVVAAVDFTSATTSATPAVSHVPLGDPGGHGTHVAGLIAGDGTASGGAYTGVAPGANIIDVRVIGADGNSDLSTVLRGLQWVLQNRRTYNIRVVNLSLGAPATTSYKQDLLDTAAEMLRFANIVVVASAGNSGPAAGTISSPADDPFVITVGAVDDKGTPDPSDDSLATFSSRGPTADGLAKPDLVAPGRRMVSLRSPGSTLDKRYPERQVSTGKQGPPALFVLSGTSMAAPVVSGVVALMLERNPSLTPAQVKRRLFRTATALAYGSPTATGAGIVDALGAVGSVDPDSDYSRHRVSDAFARDAYSYIFGQPIPWRDLAYNGGVDARGIPWSAITWGNVSWTDITWDNVSWESFSWQDISWETITWETITWETTSELSVGTLSVAGSSWELVDQGDDAGHDLHGHGRQERDHHGHGRHEHDDEPGDDVANGPGKARDQE